MTSRTITLNLSRWHVIADRLRASATALQKEASQTLGQTRLQYDPTAVQKTALLERGQKALEQVEQARAHLQAVSTIREALAAANAAAGVSQMLSRIEGLRQEARLVGTFADIDLLTKVSLDDVAKALESTPAERPTMYGVAPITGVPACLVNPTALDGYRLERLQLDLEVNALSDQLNDKNRQNLTLELPEDVIRAAGLANQA